MTASVAACVDDDEAGEKGDGLVITLAFEGANAMVGAEVNWGDGIRLTNVGWLLSMGAISCCVWDCWLCKSGSCGMTV